MALLSPIAPGSQALSREAAEARLRGLAGWELQEDKGLLTLHKSYTTRHFLEAMELAGRITTLAEAEDHHPHLGISWGSLTVGWSTHKLHGLHENDFLMAAATDAVITQYFNSPSRDS